MANGVHQITSDFEKSLSDYTGAPYVVALDNMSNEHHYADEIDKPPRGYWRKIECSD